MINETNHCAQKIDTMSTSIFAPLIGEILPLSQVPDPTFAKGLLGEGLAIVPTQGTVYSPVCGTIAAVFSTAHAIMITSDFGADILIHIGLDTVHLKGEHFTLFVKRGDEVKQGDALLDFDLKAMLEKGFNLISPIVVCNMEHFSKMHHTDNTLTKPQTIIMELEELPLAAANDF